jgi:hypothetical protein
MAPIIKDELNKDKEEARAGRGDIFWVPKPGKHRIRILDRPNKNFYVKRKFHHLDVGGQRKSVMCSENDCPICQLASRLARQGDRASAQSLQPRLRYFCVVVPLLEQPLKARIFGFGVSIFDELCSYAEDPEWGDAILKNDIILEREGEGINTEYRVRVSNKSTPIPKEVLADVPDLDEILVPRDREYIVGLLADTEFAEEATEEIETSLPRCFGMYDSSDPDCKTCQVARRCAKKTIAEE